MNRSWILSFLIAGALACSEAVSTTNGDAGRWDHFDASVADAEEQQDLPRVVINEVAASGAPSDWFELYNLGDVDIELAGLSFTDDFTAPAKAQFEAGAMVPAHGFYLRYLTSSDPGFNLGSDEELAIFSAGGTMIDSVDWAEGASPAGKTYGRLPDGTGAFKTLGLPTPGAANRDEEQPPPAMIVVNEVSAVGDDRIELLNLGANTVALEGWSITDSAAHRYVMPSTVSIAAGEYRVLTKGIDHRFGLGSTDAVQLFDPMMRMVDETSWVEPEADPSYCRQPNGSGAFTHCDLETFGRSNEGAMIDVVINEVTSSGDDQIELYNRGAVAVELGGWSVSDSDPTAPDDTYVLTAPRMIAAHGYLVLTKASDHVFGLGGADSVFLYGARGEVIDQTTWLMDDALTSWCRTPNGTGAFASCAAASFGDANP